MPSSIAATPEAAILFAISSERFLLGWPAIRYGTSCRSPSARSAVSSRAISAAFNGVHVLVTAPGQANEDPSARSELPRHETSLVQRVRGLERGHDALKAGAQLERS